jgi:pseudouridylate synthase
MHTYLDIHPEVQQALNEGRPVVALESTIISHGMPYPENVQTAREVEAIIREQGAVPATIGIIDGRIKIGLSHDELESFGQAEHVLKVSRRDLPYVIAAKTHGATTVAATMICAKLAGISVFVTGGLGGVHREGEVTMDISADLTELAQTDVAVVCAGAKSILDLGRTLEYLETQGVPVLGYQSDDFPAFYTRSSGYGVDYRLNTPEEVALFLKTKWELGLHGGTVIANPVPEEHALDHDEIEMHIERALAEAKAQGIKGKEATPFLLAKMKEITGGKSLETNIALIKHNAFVGAQIAKAYAQLGK